MSSRSTDTLVTFVHPFSLTAMDGQLPAGTYRVTLDEEEISGLSFVAFRRRATLLHLPALGRSSRKSQMVTIDPAELDAAREADARLLQTHKPPKE